MKTLRSSSSESLVKSGFSNPVTTLYIQCYYPHFVDGGLREDLGRRMYACGYFFLNPRRRLKIYCERR